MIRFLLPLFLLILLLSATGCEQLVLGEETPNDPENNFDIFWNDFDQHYGLFTVRGWNWDSIRTEYEPLVTAETTDEELFGYFREMISYLDDSHTFVFWPGREFYSSGSEGDAQSDLEFSYDVLYDNYVEVIDSSGEEEWLYGNLTGHNIGYLHFSALEQEKYDFLDRALDLLWDKEALIIDIRRNSGGADQVSEAISSRFADREVIAYTVEERNGPGHNDFASKKEYYTRIGGPRQYRKPIVVLTDTITISAGETFLLYMKYFDDVTQIGTGTSGDFSDSSMRRFLPNGMQYRYSIMRVLTPDGRSLDGIGHIPDIHARNTPEDIEAGRDVVMDRAYRFLFEEYGIE